jgi:hypothetical protein
MSITGLNFPSAAEVTAEEAELFRRASPADRMRAIRSALSAGALAMRRSPRSEFLRTYCQTQEDAGREAIARFIARHVTKP